jgi:septal ring factor EnvC (AmiA/AmiB activator)
VKYLNIVFLKSHWRAIGICLLVIIALYFVWQWSQSLEDEGRFKAQYEQLKADKAQWEKEKAKLEKDRIVLEKEIARSDETIAALSRQLAANNVKIATVVKTLNEVKKSQDEKAAKIRFGTPDAVYTEVQRLLAAIPDPR